MVVAFSIVIGVIALIGFGVFLEDRSPYAWLFGLIFVLCAGLVAGAIPHIHHADQMDKSFTQSAYSVFRNIRQVADGLPSGDTNQFGKIFLQDTSTIMIISSKASTGNNKAKQNFGAKNSYTLPVSLPNSDYVLTGSLTSDNKNWCFDIKEGNREAVYNQDGPIRDNLKGESLGLSSCLDGVAYDFDGHKYSATSQSR